MTAPQTTTGIEGPEFSETAGEGSRRQIKIPELHATVNHGHTGQVHVLGRGAIHLVAQLASFRQPGPQLPRVKDERCATGTHPSPVKSASLAGCWRDLFMGRFVSDFTLSCPRSHGRKAIHTLWSCLTSQFRFSPRAPRKRIALCLRARAAISASSSWGSLWESCEVAGLPLSSAITRAWSGSSPVVGAGFLHLLATSAISFTSVLCLAWLARRAFFFLLRHGSLLRVVPLRIATPADTLFPAQALPVARNPGWNDHCLSRHSTRLRKYKVWFLFFLRLFLISSWQQMESRRGSSGRPRMSAKHHDGGRTMFLSNWTPQRYHTNEKGAES